MRLTPNTTKDLITAFPREPWQRVTCASLYSADKPPIPSVAGNYAFLLPACMFAPTRRITLAGPGGRRIEFEFAPDLHPAFDSLIVMYAGKATDLAKRFSGHLRGGNRSTFNQVLCGLVDSGCCPSIDEALRVTKADATIVYCKLTGDENAANRDLLEHRICADFAPPFNIKSER